MLVSWCFERNRLKNIFKILPENLTASLLANLMLILIKNSQLATTCDL